MPKKTNLSSEDPDFFMKAEVHTMLSADKNKKIKKRLDLD